jgi:hypothetical protein
MLAAVPSEGLVQEYPPGTARRAAGTAASKEHPR